MFRSNEVLTAVGNIRTVRAYLDDKKIEFLKRAREGRTVGLIPVQASASPVRLP